MGLGVGRAGRPEPLMEAPRTTGVTFSYCPGINSGHCSQTWAQACYFHSFPVQCPLSGGEVSRSKSSHYKKADWLSPHSFSALLGSFPGLGPRWRGAPAICIPCCSAGFPGVSESPAPPEAEGSSSTMSPCPQGYRKSPSPDVNVWLVYELRRAFSTAAP